MELDTFLREYDISDEVAVTVDADPETVWAALMDADMLDVGRRRHLVAALGGLRMLPEAVSRLWHGEPMPEQPERMRLRDAADGEPGSGAWVMLGEEPGRAIALGLVGRFWKPVIEYAAVPADRFTAFDEPGWAKTIYVLRVEPLGDRRTRLSGAMRTATTDEHARRWFRRYWTLGVGSGAHLLVIALIELTRDDAEARVKASRAPA